MTYVVVVADRIHEVGFELLRAEPELEIVSTAGEPERFPAEIRRAHALIVRSETKVTEELIASAADLIVIGRAGVGVDNVDVGAATRRGIAVLNAPGANTVSAGEHAFALMLAAMRKIPWAAASMWEGRWARREFLGTELRGKTLGVIGLGRIGAHVATLARAFGMRVVAHDPYLPEERAAELGVDLLTLDELLPLADVVTLHLPLTDETRHVLNRDRVALLKPTAVVVNTARGGLIDTEALLAAVEEDRIAGAALDVFDPEPLAADSPLRRCDRIILTPHLAASTSEAQERVATEICRAVRDALLTGAVGGAVNLPGISSEVLVRLAGVLELARRLGRLATGIAKGRVCSVLVSYGGADVAAPRPVMLAALEGVLTTMGVGPVSLVNAFAVADERGIKVERHVGDPVSGFETTIGVTLDTGGRETTVVGAMIGEHTGRIIRVDDFAIDVPADGYVLILLNRDVPGVIGRVGTLLGEAEVNIGSYQQSRGEPGRSEALAAIVIDQPLEPAVIEKLAALSEVIEVRIADLNGSQRLS